MVVEPDSLPSGGAARPDVFALGCQPAALVARLRVGTLSLRARNLCSAARSPAVVAATDSLHRGGHRFCGADLVESRVAILVCIVDAGGDRSTPVRRPPDPTPFRHRRTGDRSL